MISECAEAKGWGRGRGVGLRQGRSKAGIVCILIERCSEAGSREGVGCSGEFTLLG